MAFSFIALCQVLNSLTHLWLHHEFIALVFTATFVDLRAPPLLGIRDSLVEKSEEWKRVCAQHRRQ